MIQWRSTLFILITLTVFVSCATETKKEGMPSEKVRAELSKEIRLSGDSQELNELRKSLPDQKRQDNDDLAEYLKKLEVAEKDPDRARNEFNQLIQQRREKFRQKMNSLRDKYSTEERKKREKFNAEQTKKREAIRGKKMKPKESQEAYTQLSEEQKDFYADERLRRKDFESEMQTQLKDFDFMIRERQQAFAEQLRTLKKKEMSTPVVPLGTED